MLIDRILTEKMSSEEEDERHTESLGAETQQFDDAASEDGDDGAGAADTAAASTVRFQHLPLII